MNPISTETAHKSITYKYYAYSILSNLWFVGAVWLYFYRLYITDQDIGIIDGMAFFIALLIEIPSWAIADAIGRKKIVMLGQVLSGVGILIQALGQSYETILIWQIILMSGVSFSSGSVEALFYSNLEIAPESTTWSKILTRWQQWALIASLIATVIGWWLHTVDPVLPWILNGIAFIMSAGILLSLAESRVVQNSSNILDILKSVMDSMKDGLREYLTPSFAYYIPILIVIQWLFYAAWYGVLRLFLLDRFWVSPFLGSVMLAMIIVVTIGLLELLHRYDEQASESQVIQTIWFLCIWGLLASLFPIGYYGIIVIFILYAGQRIMYIRISNNISQKSSDTNRATMLSIYSFLRAAPYIVLAPMLWYLNLHGLLWIFLSSWSLLILMSIVLSRRLKPHSL